MILSPDNPKVAHIIAHSLSNPIHENKPEIYVYVIDVIIMILFKW